MRKILIKLLILTAFVSASCTTNAQFATAVGARYGLDAGFGGTLLQFLGDRNQMAVNLIVSAPYGGVRASGTYELHIRNHSENIEVTGVGFFLGLGGHLGKYKTLQYRKNTTDPISNEKVFVAGVDGMAGIEWKIPTVPLLLSVDFHPFIDLNYHHQPQYWEAGIALRYLFGN